MIDIVPIELTDSRNMTDKLILYRMQSFWILQDVAESNHVREFFLLHIEK